MSALDDNAIQKEGREPSVWKRMAEAEAAKPEHGEPLPAEKVRAIVRASGFDPDNYRETPYRELPAKHYDSGFTYGADSERALYNAMSPRDRIRYTAATSGTQSADFERVVREEARETLDRRLEDLTFPANDPRKLAKDITPFLGPVTERFALEQVEELNKSPEGQKHLRDLWTRGMIGSTWNNTNLEYTMYEAEAMEAPSSLLAAEVRRLGEDTFGGKGRVVVNLGKDVVYGAANTGASMITGAVGIALDLISTPWMGGEFDDYGPWTRLGPLTAEQAKEPLVPQMVEAWDEASQALDGALSRPPSRTGNILVDDLLSPVATGLGSTVPFLGMGKAPLALRYAASVGVGRQETHRQALEYGVTPENARWVALFGGLVSGALEMAGVETIFRAWRTPSPAGAVGVNIIKAAGGEGVTETGQTLTAAAAAEIGLMLDGDYSFDPVRLENAAWNSIKDGLYGGITGGMLATAGSQPVRTFAKQRAYRGLQRFLDNGSELLSKAPDIRTRPAEHKAVIEDIVEKSGAPDRVYIDAADFERFFQGDTDRMRETMVDLDVTRQQLQAAKEAGAQIEVSSKGLLYARAANPENAELGKWARPAPEGPTLAVIAEERLAEEEARAELAAIKENNETLPEPLKLFRDQIMDSGYDARGAQDVADMNFAMAKSIGKRMGLTAEQFLDLNPIKVMLARDVERAKTNGGAAVRIEDARIESEALAAQAAYVRDQAERKGKREYVPAPNGETDYGTIPGEIFETDAARQAGMENVPIRMERGTRFWGWKHIERRHRDQIINAGFSSIEDFVATVTNNFDEIRKGEKDGRIMLVKRNGKNSVLAIQLTKDAEGNYYSVTNGFIRNGKVNGELVWERRTTLSSDSGDPTLLGQAVNPNSRMTDSYGREGQTSSPNANSSSISTIPAEPADVNAWNRESLDTIMAQAGIAPEQTEAFVKYAQAMLNQGEDATDASALVKNFETAIMMAEGVEQAAQGLEHMLANPGQVTQAVFDYMGIDAATVQEGLTAIQERAADLRKRAEAYREFHADPDMRRLVQDTAAGMEGAGKRGDVLMTPDVSIIRLFAGKQDRSTIVHELYHVYSGHLAKAAKMEGAPEQVKADYAALNQAVDGGLESPDPDIRRAAEERTAAMFEKYLSEGQAPSPGLADAFRRFRVWLANIYRGIREFAGIELSPEVRGVFDRMLATDEDIAQARQYYHDLETLAPPSGATAGEAADMVERAERTRRTAEERQHASVLKEYLSSLGGRRELWRQTRAEVAELRQYKALAEIRAEGGMEKIDDIALLAIADKYGYASVEAMRADIAAAPRYQNAVREAYDRRIAEAEEEVRLISQASAATPVDDAYHNDDMSRAMAAKQAVLDRQAEEQAAREGKRTARRITDMALRRIAADTIAERSGRTGGRYFTYVAAYRQHAEAAARADATGDKITAAAEYQKVRLNHHLIRESIQARKDVADFERKQTGVLRWTRRLEGRDRKKPAPVEKGFREAIKHILTSFKVTRSDLLRPEGTPGATVAVPGTTDPSIAALAQPLAEYIPEWIITLRGANDVRTWKDLSVGQIRELGEALDILVEQGRGTLKALRQPGIETIEDAVRESVKRMSARDERPRQFGRGAASDGFWNKLRRANDQFWAKALVTEYMMSMADGNTDIAGQGRGPMQNLVVALREGFDRKNLMYMRDVAEMAPHMRVLRGYAKRFKNMDKSRLGEVPEGLRRAYGLDLQWDGEMPIMVALNVGTERNLKAITGGYGMDQAQIDAILSTFTSAELDAIQGIWDVVGKHADAIDATTFNLTNRNIAREEAKPVAVTLPDGGTRELRGGYFPLVYDGMVDTEIGAQHDYEVSMNKNAFDAARMAPRVRAGFTMGRVGAARPPVLKLDTIANHLEKVARYVHLAQAVKEADAITANQDWADMFTSRFGMAKYEAIRQHLKYIADPDSGNLGKNDSARKVLGWLRNKATVAALGFRVKTGLKQRLDTAPAILNMAMRSRTGASGLKYYIKGVREIGWAGNAGLMNERMERIYEKSAFMRGTVGNVTQDMRNILNEARNDVREIRIGTRSINREGVYSLAFAFMTMQDRAARAACWAGAYQMALDGNADFDPTNMTEAQIETEAIRFADAIATTFSATTDADLTAWQRDDYMRMFTTFLTGTVRRTSRLYQYFDAYRQGQLGAAAFAKAFVADAAVQAWVPAFLAMGLRQLLGDDDDEITAGGVMFDIFFDPLLAVIDGVPLFNTGAAAMRYKRGDVFVPSGINEASRRFNRAMTIPKNIEKKEWDKAGWKTFCLFGYVAGVPVENIERDGRTALEVLGVIDGK